ncbi:MAG TPA: type II secretion system minor pseudopilin GspK [Candidatus Methylomirabilis sp.]|nr:type II secretion system minor pseudopilin GspK [Candidatus Methylomirabilis sp.]
MALITAMLVVAIVATAAAYLSLDQQIWLRQAQNQSDREQAEAVRQAAEGWAIIILDKAAKTNNSEDDLTQNWAQPLPALPVEGGQIAGQITDAQAKFNLNNLVRNNAPSPADVGVFRHMLETLSIDPNLTDAVIDWIDSDSTTLPYGAEDIDYLQMKVPYRAANQPFTSVDELRLVRGFTPEIVDKLRPYVTVLPQATTINVNTATPEVLSVLFNLPASAISQITQQGPFKNTQDFTAKIQPLIATGTALPNQSTYGVQSSFFEVRIDAQFGRYRRTTISLINRGAGGGVSRVLWHRQVLPGLAKTTENPDTSSSGNI